MREKSRRSWEHEPCSYLMTSGKLCKVGSVTSHSPCSSGLLLLRAPHLAGSEPLPRGLKKERNKGREKHQDTISGRVFMSLFRKGEI